MALLFVHPEHRRRGAASMLIDWGTRKADELGIEAFVEATDDGKPCYESHGFVYMNAFYLDSTRRNPSKKWMELGSLLKTPIHCYLMWRPKGGNFEEGKTVVPWDQKYYKNY
jgi:GNAT superfamily N-acetyltransferase